MLLNAVTDCCTFSGFTAPPARRSVWNLDTGGGGAGGLSPSAAAAPLARPMTRQMIDSGRINMRPPEAPKSSGWVDFVAGKKRTIEKYALASAKCAGKRS